MILFLRTKARYGGFSNFSMHPVRVYGLLWPTSEHAYQGMKFAPHRADIVRKILLAATPRAAAKLGRDPGHPPHEGWEREPAAHDVPYRLPDARHVLLHPEDGTPHVEPLYNRRKDLIMYEIVYAKITQHPDLRALLLNTGALPIVEDSPKDSYWGRGPDHRGENKLGRVLMAIRNALVHGAATQTAFGKPDRVPFVCTPDYPWQTDFGQGEHPDAQSTGRVGREYEGFECINCSHYFEVRTRPAV